MRYILKIVLTRQTTKYSFMNLTGLDYIVVCINHKA